MASMTSRDSPITYYKDIFQHVKRVIFLGTPHYGSWMADRAKIPAAALGVIKSTNRSLLSLLQTKIQLLESVQISFLSMIRDLHDNH
jgi:protein SERAC1